VSLGAFAVPSSGDITLTDAVTSIDVGYPYFFTIETLPPSLQLPDGESAGRLARIAQIEVWFSETLSARVGTQDLILRLPATPVESAPPRFSGVKRFFALGYSREPTTLITQIEPLPARVLAIKERVVA
jgi:hypothetical protein